MSDMFKGLREAIWSELAGGKNINSFRRGLQRAHLTKLIELVVKPALGIPEDATTLARSDLVVIKSAIDRSKGRVDDVTRAHLEETRARIDAALKAAVQRQVLAPSFPGM